MAFAVPLMSINLILSWIWLSYLGWKENKKYQLPGEDNIDPKQKEAQILNVMKRKYDSLGPLRCHELSVLICFIIVILLWFFRKPLFMFGKKIITKSNVKIKIFIKNGKKTSVCNSSESETALFCAKRRQKTPQIFFPKSATISA